MNPPSLSVRALSFSISFPSVHASRNTTVAWLLCIFSRTRLLLWVGLISSILQLEPSAWRRLTTRPVVCDGVPLRSFTQSHTLTSFWGVGWVLTYTGRAYTRLCLFVFLWSSHLFFLIILRLFMACFIFRNSLDSCHFYLGLTSLHQLVN